MNKKAMYDLDNLDPFRNVRSEKVSSGMVRYFQYLLKVVKAEKNPIIFKK